MAIDGIIGVGPDRLIINGTAFPGNGIIICNNTIITRVDVIKDGARTVVWISELYE